MGKSGLLFLTIPHPLGGLREIDVEVSAKKAFEKLYHLIQGHSVEENDALKPDKEPLPERLSFMDEQEAYDCFEEQGWTDGLPIILPAQKSIEKFLAQTQRTPEETIGEMPPWWSPVKVEKIVINSVMAGCRPEYFPVILAAVEAVLDPAFNLNGVQATTHPCSVLLIINGPIGKKLGINAKHNCFGQGWRANATIGRAIRLILMNVGGGAPGSRDKATMGHPGKYS